MFQNLHGRIEGREQECFPNSGGEKLERARVQFQQSSDRIDFAAEPRLKAEIDMDAVARYAHLGGKLFGARRPRIIGRHVEDRRPPAESGSMRAGAKVLLV